MYCLKYLMTVTLNVSFEQFPLQMNLIITGTLMKDIVCKVLNVNVDSWRDIKTITPPFLFA